ncbi:core promoter Hypothetical protein [Nesidiocoris tenuis]|uniref:SAM domain-containing protein n=1 Tax=Nesidiocoris tenuis TaxID=355587 RepID=A0ABN7BAE3_9HEMI|nr:core promoter Hypothetical protein [Nesidiocoris tenuis]
MIGDIGAMDGQVQQQQQANQQLMHQQAQGQQQDVQQQGGQAQQQLQVQSNTNQQMEMQQQVQTSQHQPTQSQAQVQQTQQLQQQQMQQQVQQVQQQPMLLVNAGGQQQMQVAMSTPQSSMCTANTISTMHAQGSVTQPVQAGTGQSQIQQVTDWNGRQVQVLQQPVQNTAYVQQVAYANTNGPMLMSGNIQLHPTQNINPGSIQVIAAGKPFGQNQIASHVIGKPMLSNQQATSFPSYATIPTTNNQQALLISQIATGVISSQPNILPAHSAGGQQQKPELQKLKQGGAGQGTNVQSSMALSGCVVSQPTMLHHLISPIQYTTCQNRSIQGNNSVQLSPWQFDTSQIPQVWTQHPHQVITAQNPIFIRGPHQDQPMFIQSPPPQQNIQQQQQQQNQSVSVAKPAEMRAQGTSAQTGTRTLSILPSMSSAQLTRGPNPTVVLSAQIKLAQSKTVRTKSIVTKGTSIQKLDAQNQTKPISPQPNGHPPGTKMIITSQGTVMPQQQLLQPKPPPLMNISAPAPIQIQSQPPKDMAHSVDETKMDVGQSPQMMPAPDVAQVSQVVPIQASSDSGVAQPMEVVPGIMPMAPVATPIASMTTGPITSAIPMVQTPSLQLAPSMPQPPQMAPITSVAPAAIPAPPTIVPCSDPPSTSASNPVPALAPMTSTAPVTMTTVTTSIPTAKLTTAPVNPVPAQQPDPPKPLQGPPKAMVKPQVLTHVIEGYVIQESSEPFPITRNSLLSELAQTVRAKKENVDNSMTLGADEPPLKKLNLEASKTPGAAMTSPSKKRTKCDICGGMLPEQDKSKKSRKYCSPECAKKGKMKKKGHCIDEKDKSDRRDWDNMESTSDSALSGPESLEESDASGENSVANAISRLDEDLKDLPTPNPLKWTVNDVCEYIKKLPGCDDYVEDFLIQEIDGQALLLLKADHLMSAMSMKLGPALKICAKIDTLRSIAEGVLGEQAPPAPSDESSEK